MSFNEYLKGNQAPPTQTNKILVFVGIIVFIFGLAHAFIYAVTTRSITNTDFNIIYAVLLTLGLISMPLGFLATRLDRFNLAWLTWAGYIWMGFFTLLFFFSFIEFLSAVIFWHNYSYWVLIVSFLVGLFSLYKGLSQPSLIQHQLKHSQLKGLKLLQISDLHIGMLHLNENWLQKIVTRINQLAPDIIVITGDLVEGEFDEITPKLEVLSTLNPNAKKYYITGNHEYINGSGPWELAVEKLGFKILHNDNDIISYKTAKILMAGIPDRTIRRFIKNKNSLPDLALKCSEQVDYRILLAHQPSSVFDLKTETCDLILSGHTHGGQIFPFHILVRIAQPVVSGFKKIGNTLVFAHQGTGLWGPPMRWFSRSEIVLFEWR
jgi:uncharacterized protein